MSGGTALCTDLYQLTMAAAYLDASMEDQVATFELFVRRLPKNRTYLMVAGLEQALAYLEALHFTPEEIAYLGTLPPFVGKGRFLEYLRDFRFTGEVRAMAEGTVAFAGEPLLQVRAPLIEAQVVETHLLTLVNFQTMIATKASRVVQAARGRRVIDFGSRRAHGPEAGVLAARASYIGGCEGTSNVEAAMSFHIPPSGTMAHSYIMSFDSEQEAYRHYRRLFPDQSVLLIDTYDVAEGARLACDAGGPITGVRLDSGDLGPQAHMVRAILDGQGHREAKIIASSDLNEYIIDDLLSQKAPIDAFGVGTEMVTSRDDPAISGVYKLVQLERQGQTFYPAKFSAAKRSYPGLKQVHRLIDSRGQVAEDLITLDQETPPEGAQPLLAPVMAKGKALNPSPPILAIQEHGKAQIKILPDGCRRIAGGTTVPVSISEELEALRQEVEERVRPLQREEE